MSHLTYPHEVAAGEALRLRLADVDDAARISGWTSAPEVRRHWNAGQPVPVEEALEKYTGRRAPDVVSYVVCEHDEPVGYVQAWQDDGRFGLDMFVAAHAQGRGIGPRAARALAAELTDRGWTPLTVDPAVDNPRAVRAWQAAGFVPTGEVGTDDGVATRMMSYPGVIREPRPT